MYGYNGKILRINLSAEKITIEEPDINFYRRYFGGWGFISYYLLKEIKPRIAPLGPDNKLVFATGVVTGAPTPGAGRHRLGAKSPLTGAFGGAEVGGFWGAELKRTGYDAIIIEGVSPTPVYLWINGGNAEIRDASKIWGLEVADSEKAIREELRDKRIRTSIIGPGGEKLVRYACILNDISHAAGRTGMGCLMGSKRLKAVAVQGKQGLVPRHPDKLLQLAMKHYDYVRRTKIFQIATRWGNLFAWPARRPPLEAGKNSQPVPDGIGQFSSSDKICTQNYSLQKQWKTH